MTKIRLQVSHREALLAFAKRVVDCPEELKAEDAAYRKAAALVQRAIEKFFPPEEMSVLSKHDLCQQITTIRLSLTAGGIEQFVFRKEEPQKVPYDKSSFGSSKIIMVDEKTTEAVSRWVLAAKTLKSANDKKIEQYRAFIYNATNFEQVLEVWPEAGQVTSIKRNLPAAVSEHTIAFIASDSKRRIRAAERAQSKAAA